MQQEFEQDYVEFNKKISDLETELVQFINNCFITTVRTSSAISLLKQFREILKNSNLTVSFSATGSGICLFSIISSISPPLQKLLDEKYAMIFTNYGRDLSNIKTAYEDFKEEPPIAWNMPPAAGRIGILEAMKTKKKKLR